MNTPLQLNGSLILDNCILTYIIKGQMIRLVEWRSCNKISTVIPGVEMDSEYPNISHALRYPPEACTGIIWVTIMPQVCTTLTKHELMDEGTLNQAMFSLKTVTKPL